MSAPEGRTSRFKSFLQTTTGMVAAVATLIAAIAGLVTTVTQRRGGSDASPEASAVTTVVSGDTSAERELRAHVPAAIRATCGAPRYPEENAVAAFNCKQAPFARQVSEHSCDARCECKAGACDQVFHGV